MPHNLLEYFSSFPYFLHFLFISIALFQFVPRVGRRSGRVSQRRIVILQDAASIIIGGIVLKVIAIFVP